ncbi:MAG: ABC-F family ATP-binding cassette domain-containing protein [Candidatus Paceibacterota bacterium]|jgi:macrolide transport system ATP-binding/permease protein
MRKNSNKKIASKIISAKNVSLSYGSHLTLNGVSFDVQAGDKIGLVGPNGCGKSSLLKLLANQIEADKGEIVLAPNISVGFQPQEISGEITGLGYLGEIISSTEIDSSPLYGLGLSEVILKKKLDEMSGGERSKIVLAKIMSLRDDLILLDEPTNNLDGVALKKLEKNIKDSKSTFIIVSHDRKLLTDLTNKIFEIDSEKRSLSVYVGNFEDYLEEKNRLKYKQAEKWQDFRDEEKRLADSIREKKRWAEKGQKPKVTDRYRGNIGAQKDRSAQVFHRVAKNLERKKENLEQVEKPKDALPERFYFAINREGRGRVLKVEGLEKKLSNGKKIGPLSFNLDLCGRLLISGPNGSGKTTLIKTIMGEARPDSGEVTLADNLKVGYLPQDLLILTHQTVLDLFFEQVDLSQTEGRKYLARFGLKEADVDKKVGDLSPGQRSRLFLALVMAQQAECLFLDEPTNHLDLEGLEALEKALLDYKGALVIISHDRRFIETIGFDQEIKL